MQLERLGRIVITVPYLRILTCFSSQDAVNKAVTSNKVVVYSKTYCPYCSNVNSTFSESSIFGVAEILCFQVKSLMKDLKVEHIVFELDTMGTLLTSQNS